MDTRRLSTYTCRVCASSRKGPPCVFTFPNTLSASTNRGSVSRVCPIGNGVASEWILINESEVPIKKEVEND